MPTWLIILLLFVVLFGIAQSTSEAMPKVQQGQPVFQRRTRRRDFYYS